MPVTEAVDYAVKGCIQDGILADFLKKNRSEVKMSIYEYDEELHYKTLREEGREEGRKEERKESICRMFRRQKTPEEINEFTGESLDYLYEVHKEYLSMLQGKERYAVKRNR